MEFIEIGKDVRTGLALVCDERDPPRYYLQDRRRRDLLAIGDRELALKRFAVRLSRHVATNVLKVVKHVSWKDSRARLPPPSERSAKSER
jgi:hypothetical protein